MLGLHRDIVELHPYNKNWATEFKKEKKILEKILGEYALDIQHVGSTSIKGLCAKPIIDIAVAVKDKQSLIDLIPILTKAGYDVLNEIDTKGEILARKGSPQCRTHYIHIEVLGSTYWIDHIWFRDYLIKHPEYIKQYEDVKKQIFAQYKDRHEYTARKNDFMQNVLRLAKQEKNK